MKPWGLIPAILLCFILIAQPVTAQTMSYDCADDMAIYRLDMVGDSPVYVTFDLKRLDGTTTSGSWSYQPHDLFGFPVATKAEITLDGDSDDLVFVTPGRLYISMYPSRNLTELDESRWIMGAGQSGAINNIAVEQYGVSSPIIGFEFVADSDITYTIREEKRDVVVGSMTGQNISQITDLIFSTLSYVINFVTSLVYWIKFFFVENLLMTVTLYISLSMVFAARKAHGRMDIFFKTFFSDQKKLFSFIMELWRMLIESIGTIRGWFRV
ncbi:MAG: hypothetical protein WC356_05565 [Candidatus Micrarchaeia archaeon]|jgi:hypothetical protein